MSSTTAAPAVQRRGGGGARRGGRFGGGKSTAGNAANAAAAQPDDTEAVRNLRAKYADKLALLREMFSDWTDEDLLFALQDAGGEVELAVGRISEGHAEQFNSVKSKKQVKKENLSTATPSSFHGTTGSANGTATIIPSSRGGRGGANAARGGRGGGAIRGGRGGSRGGATRGGQSAATEEARVGELSTDPSTSASATTTSKAPTFADTVAATKQNGATSGAWGDDTEGLDLQAEKSIAAAPKEQSTSTDPAAAASATTADQTSEDAKSSNPISNAIQKVTAKLVPKGSKLSWAQVARPAEPVKEQPQPPKEAPTAPAAQRAKNAKTLPNESTSATEAASKAPEKSEISHPIAAAPIVPAPQDEPALASFPATEAPIEPASTAVEADPVSSTVPSATEATAASGRPAASRSTQSQRAVQRAKQDAAVVMPGGNAQFDSLGKRFGGLSFLGGDEADSEAQAQAAAPGTEQAAAVVPVTAATPASAPTHQDAFAQATSPQQFTEKESFNAHQYGYQQGLQQHQQAHQAAVAQAQNQNQSVANLSQQQQNTQVPQQQDSQPNQFQQNSTGYGIQGQQQSQQQAQTQTPQAGQQGAQQAYGDYSSMYGGLDSQRLAGYYGNYDSNAASRGNDDRSALNNNQQIGGQQQPAATSQTDSSSVGGAPQVAPPQQQQQQQAQQQQQFPNMMPYYYPHYYLPNQFQHFGQPAAGYGQYALYGGQPQHPTKPTTPASLQSPYAQNLPHNDVSSSNPYGNTGNVGQYNQSPANTTALASSTYGDYGRGAPNSVATDYTKLYGTNNASSNNVNNNTSSSIPGLSGFLGQQPSNGAGSQTKTQGSANAANANSLDNAYRQYDSSKLTGPSPARQGSSVGLGGNQTGQVQSGLQNQQSQAQPHQQQSQSQQPQQQQHYYQQYNAYAGHQQPNNASANYASYPYRQYWGQ
ncbi:hypothetical protein L7F22_052774 [Adiantum nelumboides]|nr:hypothetical protein [Adiantum nelumboides]